LDIIGKRFGLEIVSDIRTGGQKTETKTNCEGFPVYIEAECVMEIGRLEVGRGW